MTAPDKFRFKDPSKYADMRGEGGPIVAAPDDMEEIVEYTRTASIAELLSDPIAVHLNMLNGTIAKPSVANIIHIYGADVLRAPIPTDARLVTVAQLERAETCLRNSGFVKAADEIRAIIGENGND